MTQTTAGVVTVQGDGTYTAVPTLGPFGNPLTATSLAQALFEQAFPLVLASMTSAQLADVVDVTTSPVTTMKGRVMQNVAAQTNAQAAAVSGATPRPLFAVQFATEVLASTAVPETLLGRAIHPCVVGSLVLQVQANAVTADPSNYLTLTVNRRAGGTGSPSAIAQLASSGTAWAAWAGTSIPLLGGAVALSAGDVLSYQVSKTGSGALLGPALIQVLPS
ncbi:MAG TPA: hypothetical protein VGI39_38990 [Polyangiaceae bacterium]|jgi:hypothetical protein